MKDERNPVSDIVNLNYEGGVDLADRQVASVISNAMKTLSYCSNTMALLIYRLTGGKEPYGNIRASFDTEKED